MGVCESSNTAKEPLWFHTVISVMRSSPKHGRQSLEVNNSPPGSGPRNCYTLHSNTTMTTAEGHRCRIGSTTRLNK